MQPSSARSARSLDWAAAPERGSIRLARFMVWLVHRAGWRPGHLLLYPITAYFLAFAPRQRAAARAYLGRALGRRAGWRDLFRLWFAFASTLLDRVFLVAGRTEGYRIEVHGLEALRERIATGRGCLLLGAHLGSFEALRAVADAGCPVEVAVLMHEGGAADAARLKAAVFDALAGPGREAAVIPLGTAEAMLRARECLERGGLVGLLADRAPGGERFLSVPFLGREAPLPTGPHLLAAVLGAPVMLAFGLWRGPRHYEVRFEPFADAPLPPGLRGAAREAAVAERVRRYAARLEALCRAYPYNWFNFYDFWREGAGGSVRRRSLLTAPALAALAAAPARADEAALSALMRAFAARPRSRATFTEEKAIPELDLPLPSQGTLAWEAPDRLEKRTTAPIQEVLRVAGGRLTYERPDRGVRQEFDLAAQPEMQALVEAIRATLAGDLAALRRHYEVGVEGGAEGAWRMVLTPLSWRLRGAVQRIVLAGRGAQVLAVDTEGNGGVTRMRIAPLP